MRILFITLTNIGDVVMSTALLNRVLAAYPDVVVDVVAGERASELFAGLPNLGELVPLRKKKYHGHYLELWNRLRRHNYDVIIDLRTPLLATLLRGRWKLRYSKKPGKHTVEQMTALWPREEAPHTSVWISPEIKKKIAAFAPPGRLLMAIAPTANWVAKQWPQRHFAALELGKNFPDMAFIVLGAAHEHNTVKDFITSLPKERTLDLVGRTSLSEAAAWLGQSHLFLGNDSGLAHLAAAVGTPTITIFGPTSEVEYAPWQEGGTVVTCAPRTDGANLEPTAPCRLITDITPDQVLEAVRLKVEEIENTRKLRQEAAC